MTRNSTRAERRGFTFSYHEHDWDIEEGEDAARAELLRRANEGAWVDGGPASPDDQGEDEDGITDLDGLKELIAATMVEEWGMPLEAIEIPLAKLATTMKNEGLRFVSGSFMEFEGNHNDSEISVVLEKER